MYKLNIFGAIKNMTIKELRDFFYESYYSRIGFTNKNVRKKDLLPLVTNIIEKLPDPCKTKE